MRSILPEVRDYIRSSTHNVNLSAKVARWRYFSREIRILLPRFIDFAIFVRRIGKDTTVTEPTSAKADLIPYSEEYSPLVRSWIESEETYFFVCRGREFPPPEDIIDSWQREDVSSFLLSAERHPVAYGELWARPNERAVEIAHLLVDPYRRGHGYGVKMLQLLYDRAAERKNVLKVVLNLYSDNPSALSCYLKAGFELIGAATHTMGLKMVRVVR